MMKIKQFSTTEKAMMITLIILIIAMLLQWKTIIKGVKKGFEPYTNEQPTNNN